MEAHAYVDRTLRIVTEMHARYQRGRHLLGRHEQPVILALRLGFAALG